MKPSWLSLGITLCNLLGLALAVGPGDGIHVQLKVDGFIDPSTGFLYRVTAYNVTQMTTESTYRSVLKVTRVRHTEKDRVPGENIQTISFHSSLVDFDLNCRPDNCYLVAVTGRTKRNVKLYSWQRTQFDLQAERDSFARPRAVKLFRIRSSFYVAIAQEQIHLTDSRLNQEYEEPARFIGCAILRFSIKQEHNLKYHQYIRLPFNPNIVNHLIHSSSININSTDVKRPTIYHYLVFSSIPNWSVTGDLSQVATFRWSPLNEYFWPFEFPRGVIVERVPTPQRGQLVLKFPSLQQQQSLKLTNVQVQQIQEPVDYCFSQLQRLLSEREVSARKLVSSSHSLWRSSPGTQNNHMLNQQVSGLTNISAQVIVRGNVIVNGSLIESPQLTFIGQRAPEVMTVSQVSDLANSLSPVVIENRLKQALFKLEWMRTKLSRAVFANFPSNFTHFNSRIRFFGNLKANLVSIGSAGIANSDVRLNGLPFRQLEHELVSLRGAQDIANKVVFRGHVWADTLEIHGRINNAYLLRDAVDITSKRIQVIDSISNNGPGSAAFVLKNVAAGELTLSPNSTINGIRLDEFITRDNRTQIIYGHKTFRNLTTSQLSLANPNVLLNGQNISRIASNSLHLQDPAHGNYQVMSGQHATFGQPVVARKLIINNSINRQINISALLHDSVKVFDVGPQEISGHKKFLRGLKVGHLTTEGSINDVPIMQVFNLNPAPPVPDYAKYLNSNLSMYQDPIRGRFNFENRVQINGNLEAERINGIDVRRHAARRIPHSSIGNYSLMNVTAPQLIYGRKVFLRPVRVIDYVRLLDRGQFAYINNSTIPYPLINDLDLRQIAAGIARQRQNPSVIHIENLQIDGNLFLGASWNRSGDHRACPLDAIKKKLILAGLENQVIETPVSINSLRAKSVYLDPGALDGLNFPSDFVLRTPLGPEASVEVVLGHKVFDHISIGPQYHLPLSNFDYNMAPGQRLASSEGLRKEDQVIFGSRATLNNITFGELQNFVAHERRLNSTGETVFQTLDVYGNIRARRINGFSWPEDILLKSLSSSLSYDQGVGFNRSYYPLNHIHRRIYSPLVFLNSSQLVVEKQLVLRGPIQLLGKLNNVNLTEFARRSATYGDKDLLSSSRPIRNKIFMGGLTVTNKIRSQGLINGVNFDDLKRRAITILPGTRTLITSPKVFLSDINFLSPMRMSYLNDLPLDQYLQRIQFQPDSDYIRVSGKKSINGALRINSNLFVQGLINKVDFIDLHARAISLSPKKHEIQFNRTLTIEGNVFMDNLFIDEKNGTIDGVKLVNLVPLEPIMDNTIVIKDPYVIAPNSSYQQLRVEGLVHDCRITCSLTPANQYQQQNIQQVQAQRPRYSLLQEQPPSVQQNSLPQSQVLYPPRKIVYNGRNVTYMQTTPPYATYYQQPANLSTRDMLIPTGPRLIATQPRLISSPPKLVSTQTSTQQRVIYPDPRRVQQALASRPPVAIQYELQAPKKYATMQEASPLVQEHLTLLRKQIVSLNFIKMSTSDDLVIGFIESPSNNIADFYFPERDPPHTDHGVQIKSFLQLDQIDFPFTPTTYHLNVGVTTNSDRLNVTRVYSSVGGGQLRQLSVLPIESPNSAMFLKIVDQQTLFLLISQDYSTFAGTNHQPQCPTTFDHRRGSLSKYGREGEQQGLGGVHVYLFHALKNSSSLSSAYFDLYQTIDLPAIDSFESYHYRGSTYVLAISRLASRVYLLLLRGYSGFQIVSHIDVPSVERVEVLLTGDRKPVLIIYQSNGPHRVMEAVLI